MSENIHYLSKQRKGFRIVRNQKRPKPRKENSDVKGLHSSSAVEGSLSLGLALCPACRAPQSAGLPRVQGSVPSVQGSPACRAPQQGSHCPAPQSAQLSSAVQASLPHTAAISPGPSAGTPLPLPRARPLPLSLATDGDSTAV